MGDVLLRQQLSVLVARSPAAGAAISQKYFEINPPESVDVTLYNEASSNAFAIAPSVTDQSLGMGTVSAGKCFMIKPDADVLAKIVNATGQSMDIKFLAGRTSVLHIEFIGIKLSNTSLVAIKGSYAIVGD